MCAAICIEKTPFTSFHKSNIVIPLLAVLKPLWPLFGSYPSLHTSLRETADNNQPIISWPWMAMCPVPTIVLLWHRPVALHVLFSPLVAPSHWNIRHLPLWYEIFFSNYLTIITIRGWFLHDSRMILDSRMLIFFHPVCIRLFVYSPHIHRKPQSHTHTLTDTVGNSQVCKSQLLKYLLLLSLYQDGDRILLLSTRCLPLTI